MIPQKPFDTYKWRWLSYAPTEGLLEPPVFLGVLRVMAKHEGDAPSNPDVLDKLRVVKNETRTRIDLMRTGERNLIRNSGQYWKGTGLLTPERGEIHLTSFGRRVAEGRITQDEFTAIMIQQTKLPNPWTYTAEEIQKWRAADLEIKPLLLILEIMAQLGQIKNNGSEAYLTPEELIKVVIPLAGQKEEANTIARYVSRFREGRLNVSNWPDCCPRSNDKRLAREFLLFLSNFRVCRKVEYPGGRLRHRYHLDDVFDIEEFIPEGVDSIFSSNETQDAVIDNVQHSSLPSIIERQRYVTSSVTRPGQSKFRQNIMGAYEGRCLLTNERISDVLEAAHIIPVKYGGADEPNNGICLRIDIHRLYDSGNIRIRPDGQLILSDAVSSSPNYNSLPSSISLPGFVNPVNIGWRDTYL